jgi:hypothetical protein
MIPWCAAPRAHALTGSSYHQPQLQEIDSRAVGLCGAIMGKALESEQGS